MVWWLTYQVDSLAPSPVVRPDTSGAEPALVHFRDTPDTFEGWHAMEWTPDDVTNMIINPFYAITISEDLAIEHAPLVSRETWIEANAS